MIENVFEKLQGTWLLPEIQEWILTRLRNGEPRILDEDFGEERSVYVDVWDVLHGFYHLEEGESVFDSVWDIASAPLKELVEKGLVEEHPIYGARSAPHFTLR
jgi:hypothetical protein